MKKIILLMTFIVIIFAEIVCVNNLKNDLNRRMRKDSNKKLNVLENQFREGKEVINEMVLGPLDMVKKILFYEVFGIFPSYLIFIFLFACFIIGKIISVINKYHNLIETHKSEISKRSNYMLKEN